jgi:hypothetical protein
VEDAPLLFARADLEAVAAIAQAKMHVAVVDRQGLDLGAGVGREAVELAVEQEAHQKAPEGPVSHGILATDAVTETPSRSKWLLWVQTYPDGKARPQSFSE